MFLINSTHSPRNKFPSLNAQNIRFQQLFYIYYTILYLFWDSDVILSFDLLNLSSHHIIPVNRIRLRQKNLYKNALFIVKSNPNLSTGRCKAYFCVGYKPETTCNSEYR